MEAIIKFLLNPNLVNAWLKAGYVKVYVRKGRHFINGDIRNTFDVANIEVTASKRGKGHFKLFMEQLNKILHEYPEIEYLYVEGVLEPRLLTYLPSIGFTMVEGSIPPSFYYKMK